MTAEKQARHRIVWVDATKGVAIVLVVFGHVLGGILARGWLTSDELWRSIYDFIYLFHMPVFFMVSGFLLGDVARSRPLEAMVSRVGSIIWPYLLWDVTIRWALLPVISPFMSSPPEHFTPLQWLTKALLGELSWFFWTLFLVQALYIAVSRLPAWLLLLASFVLAAAFPDTGLGPVQYLIDFMPFLLVGVVAQPFRNHLQIEGRPWHLAAALMVFALLAASVAMEWTQLRPLRLVCNVAGIFATIIIVQCTAPKIQASVLSRLGMASLAIYVLHPYFQGAARGVLSAVAGNDPLIQIAVQTIVAVLGPLLIWLVVEHIGAGWLFRVGLRRPVTCDRPPQ